jgi:hypothetical protein
MFKVNQDITFVQIMIFTAEAQRAQRSHFFYLAVRGRQIKRAFHQDTDNLLLARGAYMANPLFPKG